jgi:MSHA pilin protein MshC
MKKQTGFTIIELVQVIVILGILSAFVVPRVVDIGTYSVYPVRDYLLSAARRAQHMAMYDANNCYRLNFEATRFGVQSSNDGGTVWVYLTSPYDPNDPTEEIIQAYNNVTIAPLTPIYFDTLGNAATNCAGAAAAATSVISVSQGSEAIGLNICTTGYATISACT